MLGLDASILSKAVEVSALDKQKKSIKQAIKEGVFSHISLDESSLKSELVLAKDRRDKVAESVSNFKVDDLYENHQKEADAITQLIRKLNNEAIALECRRTEIISAISSDIESIDSDALITKLI
jgi:hypothetical protein